jgi:hypothetical protein
MARTSPRIFPHLWYAREAEEAARFYTSIFPDSRVDRVTTMQSESPSGPPGSVKVVDFTLFGQRFQTAIKRLEGETDSIRLIALTANVARAIYEAESSEIGLIRGVSAFSPALSKLEREFEELRFDMQKERVELLFKQRKQTKGLTLEEARRILWMYTSREVYRLLVHEAGWTPARYEEWLSDTLLRALADPNVRRS